MIRKIKFNNFYSFKDEQEISFLTSKKKSYDYFTSSAEKNGYCEQITKVAGVISKNAAGKTNVIRALGFISFFAINKKTDLQGTYKTYFNNSKQSKFSIEFEIDDDIYDYSFTLKDGAVKEEILKHKGNIIFSFISGGKIYMNEEYSLDIVPVKTISAFKKDISFLASINTTFDIDIFKKVSQYFNNFTININELGQKIPETNEAFNSSEKYGNNPKLKKEVENFINNFDLGPNKTFDINIKNTKSETGTAETTLELYTINNIKGKKTKLSFLYESTGTRVIYYTLAKLFYALKNNGILILDEIETGLHPEALNKIIQYFIDENSDGRAQLIFSTHDLSFLKKFKKDQVFLIEKDNNGVSIVQRLDKKFIGGRTEDNLLAKYNSGIYGSYPDIRI